MPDPIGTSRSRALSHTDFSVSQKSVGALAGSPRTPPRTAQEAEKRSALKKMPAMYSRRKPDIVQSHRLQDSTARSRLHQSLRHNSIKK